MFEKMNYYFEVWKKHESFRKKITKEEAYRVLHMYGMPDEIWTKEEICVLSTPEMICSLVRSKKEYECNVA